MAPPRPSGPDGLDALRHSTAHVLAQVEPGVSFPSGAPYQFFMDRFLPAYRAELAAFTEVVAGSRPSPCTVAAALEAGWIAEACTTSLQQHRPVRMEEVRT